MLGLAAGEFVSQYTVVYYDLRGLASRGSIAIQFTAGPRHGAAMCAARRAEGERGGRPNARTRPRYGSLALRHDQLGPATRLAGRPRHGQCVRLGAPVRAWVGWLGHQAVHLVHSACF